MKNRILISVLCMMCALLCFTACGNNLKDNNTENDNNSEMIESESMQESEAKIEIVDATELLTKAWELYETPFDVMGGHFTSPVMGAPAKYDLSMVEDLTKMYCVPLSEGYTIDDAATLVDFYNAVRFTMGAFHVTEVGDSQELACAIKAQVYANEWYGKMPEQLLIMEINHEYVVAMYGNAQILGQMRQNLESIYDKSTSVLIEEYLAK